MASYTIPSIMDKEEGALEKTPAKALRHPPRPKKRGAFNIVRAALFMARKNKPSSDIINSNGKGLWSYFVKSMRPLYQPNLDGHLKLPLSLRHSPMNNVGIPPPPLPENYHDVLLPPPSPASSTGGMSRYASAEDLKEFEESDEVEDGVDEEVNQIDLKAEEFIASFYKQMRVEKMEEMGGRNYV